MRTEIKTAIIMGIIIAGAIGGLSAYFTSLETPGNADTQVQSMDKSRFKKAPELQGIAGYINTDADDLKDQIEGKVVLYDIWTYSCINCQRTIPYIVAWNDKYSDKGLVIVGVHSPEFEFEKDINNVRMATEKFGIEYPVVLDNDKEIWSAFSNNYWPRKYIADDEGYIRYDHIGEGAYAETEKIIQDLLNERSSRLGLKVDAGQSLVEIQESRSGARTPELYFGYDFAYGRDRLGNAEGFNPDREVRYVIPGKLQDDYFYLDGVWKNVSDRMILVSDSGIIKLPYFAKEVNIVASGESELAILLDGKQVSQEDSGGDTEDGKVRTSESRLYNLVKTKEPGRHTLEIQVSGPGFEIYTFTFG
ncbi:redoxin family protein [Candidatus Nitrosotenuis chungbukensis]|uniref:redoxin family protein n=2 Tax=Candidatus Nitrosotenuis chungbukensis TaxID=1353246 RepID=UPI0005B27A4C|nr:redoxin family protein [Candidatus Nitrosotenuis chungbukensis]